MKISSQTPFNSISGAPSFHGAAVLSNKFAKSMTKFEDFGEATNISFDFIGKAVVTPMVIMLAANETREKKHTLQ